ncbi:isoprenyl transferase [Megasphaera sueciensis]|jgi:undecaprenyl diphosphate synthase|uniref:isoprenyl transferase n=1 Tax=Megasphaera sueciensis TaxID=349094 RepID=UPI003D009CCA
MKNLFFKKESNTKHLSEEMLDKNNMPHHIAIIMDGNGRWAKKRGMPRSYGHHAGADTLKQIVRDTSDLGVKVLTVYAFSTENWKRPKDEVSYLMNLIEEYLRKNLRALEENNVSLHFIGDIGGLNNKLQQIICDAEQDTANNTGLVLNLAINYGGRLEITEAMQHIASDVLRHTITIDEINESLVGKYLYTAPHNDVDLLIRPGADKRVSNFLLWQMAYAEFWFTELCWPDFTKETLIEAILSFQSRDRRFGGLK